MKGVYEKNIDVKLIPAGLSDKPRFIMSLFGNVNGFSAGLNLTNYAVVTDDNAIVHMLVAVSEKGVHAVCSIKFCTTYMTDSICSLLVDGFFIGVRFLINNIHFLIYRFMIALAVTRISRTAGTVRATT